MQQNLPTLWNVPFLMSIEEQISRSDQQFKALTHIKQTTRIMALAELMHSGATQLR